MSPPHNPSWTLLRPSPPFLRIFGRSLTKPLLICRTFRVRLTQGALVSDFLQHNTQVAQKGVFKHPLKNEDYFLRGPTKSYDSRNERINLLCPFLVQTKKKGAEIRRKLRLSVHGQTWDSQTWIFSCRQKFLRIVHHHFDFLRKIHIRTYYNVYPYIYIWYIALSCIYYLFTFVQYIHQHKTPR